MKVDSLVHLILLLRLRSIKLPCSISLISQLIIPFIPLVIKILRVHLKFQSMKVFIRSAQGNLMSSNDRRKHPNDNTRISSGLTFLMIFRLHYYIFLDIHCYFQNISLLEKCLENWEPILIQKEILNLFHVFDHFL